MNKLVRLLDHHVEVRRSVLDIILGAIVIVFFLFMLLVGVNRYITEGYGNSYGITPRTFPTMVFGIAILLGAVVLAGGIKKAMQRIENEERVDFYLIHLAVLADIIFFVVCMKPLGYPVTNVIMIFIMYYLSGGKSWWKGLLLSGLFTLGSTLFFFTYLKLSIPMGVIEPLIY